MTVLWVNGCMSRNWQCTQAWPAIAQLEMDYQLLYEILDEIRIQEATR